jgi:DDE_Tnp_1-associated
MQPTSTLNSVLEKIPDPREQDQLVHPLPGLMKLVLLGNLCGRVTLKAAWRLGKRLTREELGRLGLARGATCHTTVTETLKALDADEVRLVFATAVRGFGIEKAEELLEPFGCHG